MRPERSCPVVSAGRYPRGSLVRDLFGTIRILTATVLIVVAGGIVATIVADVAVHDAISEIAPLDKANAEIRLDQLDIQASGQGYVLTSSPSLLHQSRAALSHYAADYRRATALAAVDPPVKRLVEAQHAVLQLWTSRYVEPAILAKQEGRPLPHRAGSGRPLIQRFDTLNGETAAVIRRQRAVPQHRLTEVVWAATLFSLCTGVVAASALLARGVRLHRKIALPLESLIGALGEIESGDLNVRVDVGGTTEIASVGNAVNSMASRLAQLDAAQAEQLKSEQLLRKLGREMRAEATPAGVARSGLRAIGPLLGADRAGIYVLGGESPEMLSSEWQSRDEAPPLGSRLEVLLGVIEQAGIEVWLGEPFLAADVESAAVIGIASRAALLSAGITAFAVAPVPAGEDTLAVLWVAMTGGAREWTQQEVRSLVASARELGTALSAARLYEQVQATMLKRAELDRAQREFVSSVSHELRTPLTSIIGYLDLMREEEADHPLDGEQNRMLDVVQRNTRRLLGLIEDILVLSRVDCGTIVPDAAAVHLDDVATSVLDAMRPLAASHSLSLVDRVSRPLAAVTGDPRQLERVLLNLVSNAVKFTPPGGAVELGAVERGGAEVVLWVADTGIGIPADEQQQLFTRFFRSSNAQRAEIAGTGLGLAIVKNLVEIHGGRIEITSEVDHGTRVEVVLPAAPAGVPSPVTR